MSDEPTKIDCDPDLQSSDAQASLRPERGNTGLAPQPSIFNAPVTFNYTSTETVQGNKTVAAQNVAEKGGKIDYSAKDTRFSIAVETSTSGVSGRKRQKEGTSREDEETSTSGVSEPKRRKEETPGENEDSTSSVPPSASDIFTPSASGSLVVAEREESTSMSVPRSVSDVTSSVPRKLHPAEIEGRARLLLKKFKLAEAISLLETSPPSVEQQMMLAECYLQTEMWDKTRNAMETLKTLMASSTPRDSPSSVYNTVVRHISDSSHIKALIFLPKASYLYKLSKNPNYAVRGLQDCSKSCKDIIEALFKQRVRMQGIAVEIGCEIILQILADLQSVTGADESERAESEASCLDDVGYSHHTIGKPTEAIGFYEQGIEIMKRQFGSNDPKILLGLLLNDLATTYESLGDFHKAVELYSEAIEAYELSQDFENEEDKSESIVNTTRNLQRTLERMTK